MLANAFFILIFPGLLFCAAAGFFLSGLDRKLVARMQRRIGPPLWQNFWDFCKLLGKEVIVPSRAARRIFLSAPVVCAAAAASCALILPVFGVSAFPGTADVIVLLYLLTLASAAIIVGGAASGSVFAGVGISRSVVTLMSYELPLMLILLAVCKAAGGERATFSFVQIAAHQTHEGLFLFDWRLMPAALAMLFVIPCEVGSAPFDAGEAGIEICEGPFVEYSGWPLALYRLAHAIKTYVMSALFVALFLGARVSGMLWLDAPVLLVCAAVVTVFSMTLAHGVCARLRVEQLFALYWGPVSALAALSLILVWFF